MCVCGRKVKRALGKSLCKSVFLQCMVYRIIIQSRNVFVNFLFHNSRLSYAFTRISAHYKSFSIIPTVSLHTTIRAHSFITQCQSNRIEYSSYSSCVSIYPKTRRALKVYIIGSRDRSSCARKWAAVRGDRAGM